MLNIKISLLKYVMRSPDLCHAVSRFMSCGLQIYVMRFHVLMSYVSCGLQIAKIENVISDDKMAQNDQKSMKHRSQRCWWVRIFRTRPDPLKIFLYGLGPTRPAKMRVGPGRVGSGRVHQHLWHRFIKKMKCTSFLSRNISIVII